MRIQRTTIKEDQYKMSDAIGSQIEELVNRLQQAGEPWCYEGGGQAVNGSCPTHNGDACLRTPEGLVKMISHWDGRPTYDPEYGDDKICECEHPYHRHFDSYENMSPVGCKYCECRSFELREYFL